MDCLVRDARRRQVLTGVLRRPAIRHVLHDLDVVPVGIFHHEVLVAGAALADSFWNRDSLRGQVVAHPIGVVGVDGNVIELPLTLRRPVEELDPLTIVDFHERDLDRSVGLRQRERLFEAEEVLVKGPGLCEVADEHGQVRHTEDLRTRHGFLGGRRHRRVRAVRPAAAPAAVSWASGYSSRFNRSVQLPCHLSPVFCLLSSISARLDPSPPGSPGCA